MFGSFDNLTTPLQFILLAFARRRGLFEQLLLCRHPSVSMAKDPASGRAFALGQRMESFIGRACSILLV